MTSVRRLFILLCGFEILPKSVSTRDRGQRFILSEPVCSYLLDTDEGWVLLDTGLNPDNIRDPVRAERYFLRYGMTPPIVRPAHEMNRQFAEIGVGFEDVRHVILSHLHFDHSGHIGNFPNARISIQRREHEVAFGNDADPAYIREDYADPRIAWDLRDGDWEAQPGLTLLDTRGHTAGHQSAMVDLRNSGTMLLPFDAGDLQENFDQEIIPGECCDADAARVSLRRLIALRLQYQARFLLFHDPVAIQTLRLAPEFYD